MPFLLQTLRNEKKRELLDSSMIALARIGGEDAYVDAITPFLCDPNLTLVETATISLGILGRPRVEPMLKNLVLNSPEGCASVGKYEVPYRVRAFATYGLGLLAHAVADAGVRQEIAATLLGLIKEDRSSAKDIRVAATICLGLFDDPEQDRSLSARMEVFENQDEDEVVRAHAPVAVAKALNLRRNPPLLVANCVKKFTVAIEERREKDRVKESCVLALGLLTDPKSPHYAEVLKVLEKTLQEAPE
ncbi:MAG TPA: hypothetical protein VFI25_03265, partial [Planctomycetota bacterium]|nr:hypothetical protein [Planctomycetota bacterium]